MPVGRFSRACRFIPCLLFMLFYAITAPPLASADCASPGAVTDPSGSCFSPKASVSLTNQATGLRQTPDAADDKGVYSFLDVQVGRYDLEITADGFKPYQRNGMVVDADASLLIDAVLRVGAKNGDCGGGRDCAAHRDIQHAEARRSHYRGAQMTAVPLNGRSYTRPARSAARGGAIHVDYFSDGAGCRRGCAIALRQFESRDGRDQWPAGIREQLYREQRKRFGGVT